MFQSADLLASLKGAATSSVPEYMALLPCSAVMTGTADDTDA